MHCYILAIDECGLIFRSMHLIRLEAAMIPVQHLRISHRRHLLLVCTFYSHICFYFFCFWVYPSFRPCNQILFLTLTLYRLHTFTFLLTFFKHNGVPFSESIVVIVQFMWHCNMANPLQMTAWFGCEPFSNCTVTHQSPLVILPSVTLSVCWNYYKLWYLYSGLIRVHVLLDLHWWLLV